MILWRVICRNKDTHKQEKWAQKRIRLLILHLWCWCDTNIWQLKCLVIIHSCSNVCIYINTKIFTFILFNSTNICLTVMCYPAGSHAKNNTMMTLLKLHQGPFMFTELEGCGRSTFFLFLFPLFLPFFLIYQLKPPCTCNISTSVRNTPPGCSFVVTLLFSWTNLVTHRWYRARPHRMKPQAFLFPWPAYQCSQYV